MSRYDMTGLTALIVCDVCAGVAENVPMDLVSDVERADRRKVLDSRVLAVMSVSSTKSLPIGVNEQCELCYENLDSYAVLVGTV